MPQNVDLGAPYGVVSFPDDYTTEQIVADYNALEEKWKTAAPPRAADIAAPTAGDYARQVGGKLIRGLGGMVASIPEQLGIAASGLSRLTGGDVRIAGEGDPIDATQRSSYQLGQLIRRGAEAIAPTTRRDLDESFLASKLPEGVGSALGFMAGGLAGKALKIPQWLGIGGLGSAASGVDFYQDAKASGADEGTAQLASIVGNVVGTSEAFPLARMMRRLDGVTGGTFSRFVIEAGKDTLEEALQEGAQSLAQNLTAQQLYDKDRSLFNDVATNAGVGGATGFLLSSLTQALGIPIGRSRVRREEQERGVARRREAIAQLENERVANAEGNGIQTQTPGSETRPVEEAAGSVRVRSDAPSGLAPQPGTEVAYATTPITVPPAVAEAEPTPAPASAPIVPVATLPIPEVVSEVAPPSPAVQAPAVSPAPVGQSPQRSVVEQVIAEVAGRWQNAPEIVVVEDVGQLPAEVRADAPAGLSLESVPGVTDRAGKVWLVAGNITDPAHATRVIMEEAVGHLGVESALGGSFDAFMRGVATRHAGTPIGQAVRAAYGEEPVTVGREIIAKLAQDPSVDPTLWQRIVGAVRGWVLQVFNLEISDNDVQVLLARARRVIESGSQPFAAQPTARFAVSAEAPSTSFFPTRAKVVAATSNPGLTPSQIQEAEDLAAVQASMVTADMVNWLVGIPTAKFEIRAQGILDYLLGRATASPTPRPLSSLPEGTTEEQRTKELAGSLQLAHYGVDRSKLAKIYEQIDVDQGLMNDAVAKIGTTTQAQHKANYLTALFTSLTSRHRQYIADLTAAGPASANVEAQWRAALNRAQERLNEQDASPTALRNGLSAIARTVPEALLNNPATTNQDVVNWVVQQGALFNVVGQATRDWMTVDDGTGTPALQTYAQLIPDLQTLKDILTNEAAVAADIDSFEAWFRNNANSAKVSSNEYAEKYFKFRTGRDRAVKIVAATEREIDRLDERIRANIMARDRLETMMADPGYRDAVVLAAEKADIVVRALYGPDDVAVGLINRDRAAGSWTLKGPLSGADYVVDLHPTTGQEANNRANLAAFVSEARAWAVGNTALDPLLADEYNRLSAYIERHLMSPSLDPRAGFTMTRVRLPFTNIRIPLDPFDGITAATGAIGYSFQTIRDVIERVGGRTVRQAYHDAATLDTVMRKVEAIDANPTYGRAAQTQAILEAMASHGWSPEQFQRWDEQVAEPVFAAAQNRLSPGYEVGDFIVGSDVKLTRADLAAIRLMKQHGDAVIAVAPHSIQERLSDLGISRKAIGNGRFTSHRIPAHWTQQFVKAWKEAPDDAAKAKVLTSEEAFRQVVLGYLAEYNPEFGRMNPASSEKSPLFLIYRRLADTEKSGVDTFRTWDEVMDFLSDQMVMRGVSPDLATARVTANTTLFSEIKKFIEEFDANVLNYVNKDIWGGVAPSVVQAVGTRNAFTTPRGRLQAPSTFYSYSTASEQRHRHHLGNLRSLLNLKLLQSMAEATAAMEAKKAQMVTRIDQLSKTMSRGAARKQVQKESAAERELGNIRYDYRELLTALQAVEQAAGNVRRYELSATDHYEHAGVAAANNFFSTVKSSLLSSTQAMTTNFWSGGLFGPALAHWQAGQFGRAMGDLVIQPGVMAKALMKRVSALVAGNPMMARLLTKHTPLWDDIAASIINASADWRRVQQIAQSAGMVTPYNLGKVLDNMGALKRSGGRLVNDDPHRLAEWVNAGLSLPGVRHVTEGLKATTPRLLDNAINYMMVINWDRETEILKKVGWAAFKARETAAAGSTDWKNLTEPANVLKPGDLGLRTNKALEWYQQLFVPLGSLDAVLLDYYERTQAMTPEQREAEPLLDDDEHAAMALQYAAKSNVSTETNRPYSLKGKGSDGVWRNVVGTFMGWGINMMHQLSKGLQTHSKDPQFPAIANSMIGLVSIIALLAAVGAWNWEFGDELTKQLYDVSSARVQVGNVQDWNTALLYLAQAVVNTVPMIGSSIGGLFGVAYTGRGNPFDMTSLSPHIGLVAGVYNTVRRVAQTGDASLPLLDFTRQWVPMSKIVLNRLPIVRGIVDQQNAVRSLNASAPPGTEIVWGKRGGGGQAKYGPANDELTKLIASAYDASARGGSIEDVQARMSEAVAAYMAAGRSQPDAVKAMASALAAKEPIRVLTGREMTPEEERKWVARMTPSQRSDYDRATAAWQLLGAVTGKDLNMVTQPAGGGGAVRIPSRAVSSGGGSLRPLAGTLGSGISGFSPVSSISGGSGGRGGRTGTVRRRGLRTTRRRSSTVGRSTTRRRIGPRIGRSTTRRRIGTRRRRAYTLA